MPRLRHPLAASLVALCLALPSASAAPSPAPHERRHALERDVEAMLQGLVSQQDWAGNVAIVYAGKQIVRGAYGTGERTWQIPTRRDAVYRVGSVTKMFTAVAVLQLVQSGRLSLDASVRATLPDLPAELQPVTIRQLLNHTSGIPEYMASTNSFRKLVRVDREPGAVLALVQDQPLRFVPGTKYDYSNTNYVALGLVIEKLTGKPYAQDVEARFLQPLGMRHSGYFDYTRIVPSLVPGYLRDDDGRLQNMFHIAPSMVYAAGNLYSSIDDLLTWDRALHDTDALGLDPALRKEMFRNQGFGYGFGAFVDVIDGEPAAGHGGTLPGYQLGYIRFMRLPLTVMVLTNVSPTDVDKMAFDLARLFFKHCGKTAPAEQCGLAPLERSSKR
ncbi:serine hydrolase [Massilia sp. YIM B02443]|uniref:serine hydrolase domain-containing protein n=1 Tax=Massilia sp. YIM B02443 TaxID=3050127 RepID=UPI0025B66E5F|nr:serine hydrolase domain-containing protein [Massilia sp. YIM B02443]MDN4038606.1 serine hydrolase domain-containing protein [Massilia sp. YIM B02443]